ncbi:PHP domain-like protein [Irpex rosettiformis]|uniref:PHP domain-like protein n=1 Tax=Irpex rosettiformis TaxID=378272 RepID=A0ACB8TQ23_9APHY|nr:PHP domain-like protein [Irpex rosettiformis]
MYIDLNIPTPVIATPTPAQSKKSKGKAPQQRDQNVVSFSPAQLTAIEARLDVLEHLGYTVFALNQTVLKKIDAKTHVNTLNPLIERLRWRANITLLKRLTIVLDEESEKGFGLTNGNLSIISPYDLIALQPTTVTTFSQACLSHTVPSNLTAHIISLPLTLPRLPFNLKHTMVRTAIKNGAVFEIPYVGALGGDIDPALGNVGGGESGASVKRNWWAAAREVVRVTKGKGIIVTSGVTNVADLRAPRDVGNLLTMLDLPQNLAHDASTKTPQSLVKRAQTRKTYRAVLSEPKIVIPKAIVNAGNSADVGSQDSVPPLQTSAAEAPKTEPSTPAVEEAADFAPPAPPEEQSDFQGGGRKRPREEDSGSRGADSSPPKATNLKKKKKKYQM